MAKCRIKGCMSNGSFFFSPFQRNSRAASTGAAAPWRLPAAASRQQAAAKRHIDVGDDKSRRRATRKSVKAQRMSRRENAKLGSGVGARPAILGATGKVVEKYNGDTAGRGGVSHRELAIEGHGMIMLIFLAYSASQAKCHVRIS